MNSLMLVAVDVDEEDEDEADDSAEKVLGGVVIVISGSKLSTRFLPRWV